MVSRPEWFNEWVEEHAQGFAPLVKYKVEKHIGGVLGRLPAVVSNVDGETPEEGGE